MKRYLGVCLAGLLFACGEAHIESVDDKTLDEATKLKLEADLKNSQTALLGTWTACSKSSDTQFVRYEYGFANDGTFSVNKQIKADAACSTDTAELSETVHLSGDYRLVPIEGSAEFHLQFNFETDKKLVSQYHLKSTDKGQFPKLVELKDDKDIALVELKDGANFVDLTRLAPDEAETYRKKAEQFLLNLGQTQLARKGFWKTVCADNMQTKMEFSGEQAKTLTLTPMKFKDKDCKTAEDTQPEVVRYSITLDSVKDLDRGSIQISLKKASDASVQKASVKITEKALDIMTFTDFVDNKSTALIVTFNATGTVQ